MRSKRITALLRTQQDRLLSLVGGRLRRVTYVSLTGTDGQVYAESEPGLDLDLEGVVLDLGDRGSFFVAWGSPAPEGLAVCEAEAYPTRGDAVQWNASDSPAWRDLIGREIPSFAAARQIESSEFETLWSLRLDFGGQSVVIALGAYQFPHGKELVYDVQEVVVIHDMRIARAFKPHHVDQSAWGGDRAAS